MTVRVVAAISPELVSTVRDLWDPIWENILGSQFSIFGALCELGLWFAGVGVAFWSLKTFRTLVQKDELTGWSSLIYPILIFVLLFNHGAVLKELIFLQRAIANNVNEEVLASLNVSYEFRVGSTGQIQSGSELLNVVDLAQSETQLKQLIRNLRAELANCSQILGESKQQCFESLISENSQYHPTQLVNNSNLALSPNHFAIYIDTFNKEKDKVQQLLNSMSQQAEGEGNILLSALSGVGTFLDSIYISAYRMIFDLVMNSLQVAFSHLTELAMLLTALLAPAYLAACLFSSGSELTPLVGWFTSFWAMAIARISLSICQGFAQMLTATVPSGPFAEIFYMQIALMMGVLSPVFAFALAAGGGLAIFGIYARLGLMLLMRR